MTKSLPNHRPTPTMKSIAEELGVSRMTISFALNGTGSVSEETRRKVLETAERLDFKPNPTALRLKGGRPLAIGLFSLWFDLGVGATKLHLIQSLLKERGHEAPLYGVGLSEIGDRKSQANAVAALRHEKPRVLVATMDGLQPEAFEELARYQDEGGVLVTYDVATDLFCDQVIFEPEESLHLATKHLLELGHRDIGIGFHHLVVSGGTRVQGYRRALREAGIEARAEWCLEGEERLDHAKAGATMARKFLALKQRPSAMAIINDGAVFSFIGELQRAGLQFPRDLSIVGNDNLSLSAYYPIPLTTVTCPTSEIAAAVVDFAASRLDHSYNGPPRRAEVFSQLVVRASTQDFP